MCEIRFGVKIVTYGFFVYSASFGSCRRMFAAAFCLSECLASEFWKGESFRQIKTSKECKRNSIPYIDNFFIKELSFFPPFSIM